VKNFKLPHAIILGSIIIALSIIYYSMNDPLSKCMKKVMTGVTNTSPAFAASVCSGNK
tara:strand:+ start:106 stop:279 length:174 start_codon:yes stop_codon:yes gene_type:complete